MKYILTLCQKFITEFMSAISNSKNDEFSMRFTDKLLKSYSSLENSNSDCKCILIFLMHNY